MAIERVRKEQCAEAQKRAADMIGMAINSLDGARARLCEELALKPHGVAVSGLVRQLMGLREKVLAPVGPKVLSGPVEAVAASHAPAEPEIEVEVTLEEDQPTEPVEPQASTRWRGKKSKKTKED